MAIYHMTVKNISRGKGKSAVASSAYISGSKIKNEYDGITHDYTKKGGVLHSEVLLPVNAPRDYLNRDILWNSVEEIEKYKNSRLAREIEFALPNELNFSEQLKLAREYIENNFVKSGMCADFAIHSPKGENENVHCHVMLTTRPILENGNWGNKSKKEYVLDEDGQRIILKSGRYKTRKVDFIDWNSKDKLELWRKSLAELTNQYLQENNIDEAISHLSYKDQGIEKVPQIHLGVTAHSLEKKGIQTERGDINRAIAKDNDLITTLKAEIQEMMNWIQSFVSNLANRLKIFAKEKDKEYNLSPLSFNVLEYLNHYYQLQQSVANNLNEYGKRNKKTHTLKKISSSINFIKAKDITTIGDLRNVLSGINAENKSNDKILKTKKARLRDYKVLFKFQEELKILRPIYKQYQEKVFFKDSFKSRNKASLDKYDFIMERILKTTGDEAIKPKEWTKKVKQLESDINILENNKQRLKADLDAIKDLNYVIDIVNDDLGIDITLEIANAIERGDKVSVIETLKLMEKEKRNRQYSKAKTKANYKAKNKEL